MICDWTRGRVVFSFVGPVALKASAKAVAIVMIPGYRFEGNIIPRSL